ISKSWKVEIVLLDIVQPLVYGVNMPEKIEGVKYINPLEIIRQQIGGPHNAAAALAVREHLRGCVVVRQQSSDRRPGEAACAVVDIHDQLLHNHAVAEGHARGTGFRG